MLDYLQPIKNKDFDFLTFLEGDVKNSIEIQGIEYRNRGEPIEDSPIGKKYHIILFRDDKEDNKKYDIDSMDHFEAILSDPLEYISSLIPSGFYGIIAKKTTTSAPIVHKMLDNFKKIV